MKKLMIATAMATLMSTSLVQAADYVIDTKGAHASINFKVKHLGFSWLTGRFNDFDGTFSYDADDVTASSITVNIDPSSVDSNHAERDKHLRSEDFLEVSEYPEAKFVSTRIEDLGNGKLKVHGDFTLHGETKPIVIDASKVGEGEDRWGDYRAGFAGTTAFNLEDFGMGMGPNPTEVQLMLHIEGIRQ